MQPLKAMVRPSAGSLIGCCARDDRSMMLSLRWPSAARSCWTRPCASGPRERIARVIRSTASIEAGASLNLISPLKPHMDRHRSPWPVSLLHWLVWRAARSRRMDGLLPRQALASGAARSHDDNLSFTRASPLRSTRYLQYERFDVKY
jgi:hypothetical protein